MKKIRWKSMLAFLLALMVVVSAVPVTQVNASDAEEETSVSGNGTTDQSEESKKEETSVSGNEITGQSEESKKEEVYVSGEETQSGNQSGEEKMGDPYGIALMSEGDITPPVIEKSSIKFLENGQEIVPGNDIHITFTGYDAESELSAENTKIWVDVGDGGFDFKADSIEKAEGTENEYIATFTIQTYWDYREWEIRNIIIGDTEKNITEIDLSNYDESGYPKFTVSELVNESVIVKSITLSKNEVVLKDGNMKDTISLTLTAEGDAKDYGKNFQLEFECEEDNGEKSTYPAGAFYWFEEDVYKSEMRFDFGHPAAGTYTLVKVKYDDATVVYDEPISFTIKKEQTDFTAPTIEFVKLYHNGAEMEAGYADLTQEDTIEIRAGVKDENQIRSVSVDISHYLQNVGDSNRVVSLEYDADLECYVGSLSLSGMYATEWGISSVIVYDIYSNYDQSFDYNNMNFYIKDSQGNISIPTFSYNVTFEMEDGSRPVYPVETTRVTTLKEMFPDGIPCSYEKEGFEFLGWYIDTNVDDYEKRVSETEEFLIDGYDIVISPVYDKREITVSLSYTGQEGYSDWKKEKLIVNSDATYRDLQDAIDDLGIQHYEGLTLTEWKTSNHGADELDKIIPKNTTYINYSAEYKEIIVDLNVSYLSEENYFVNESEKLLIDKGTTYGELIDKIDLTKYKHYSGITFKEWKLDDSYADRQDEVIANGSYVRITAEYEEVMVQIRVSYLSENGYFTNVNETLVVKKDTTYGRLTEEIDFSKYSHYNGVTFKEWKLDDTYDNQQDEVVTHGSYIVVTAEYEENPISVYYKYYDADKNVISSEKLSVFEQDVTYNEVFNALNLGEIKHAEDFGFTGEWKVSGLTESMDTVVKQAKVTFEAQYSEKNILDLYYYYYDKQSRYHRYYKGVLYQEGDTYQDILDKNLISEDVLMNGFTHWEYYFGGSGLDDVISGENPYLTCYSYYSGGSGGSGSTGGSGSSGSSGNSGSTDSSDSTDNAETFTEPAIATKPEETKQAEENATAETTLPVIPQLRQETTVPEFPTLSTEEENTEVKPAVKLEEEVIAQKVEEAQNLEEGTELVIEMAKEDGELATEVPVAVLEAVRGKNVDIVLDMGGYSWNINGQDVLATDLSAINLEVTMDTEAVAPSIIEKLAGGEPARQISLTHNGDFGFKASLTINVGSEHEGEFGNLYYHDSNGKLVFMNAGQVDADGNVSLDFSHASDYVVVVGRDRTEEENQKAEESMPAEIIDEEVVLVEEEVETTGNGLIPVVIVFIIVAAVAGIVLVKKNKK